MPLTPGTRIGVFEITGTLGAGGMGEVYRATDTSLGRQVAIKVLPEAVAADPERLARFDREAKTLAALNHPNIAQIHGLEKSDGQTALVMELVEGPTLADRIAQGPIPVDEALQVARQIAEALEAAHEQGIIHRDLKPANVKLREDGTVKVLDFGLAKAMEPGAGASPSVSESPTITTPAMTQAGLILGTAAYMSPEQAKGKAADRRSDVWAFGAVLYEMLTGRRAFEAEDMSETLAAVLRAEVDWNALPAGLPATLPLVLMRCLQKDPRQRMRDVADVRLALEGAFELAASAGDDVGPAVRRARPFLTVAAALAGGLAVAVVAWVLWPAAPPMAVSRFPLGEVVPPAPAMAGVVAISPDGRQVAYVSGAGIQVRDLSEADFRLLPDTEGGTFVTFSPDGQAIAFARAGQLWRLALGGGAQQSLATLPQVVAYGIHWAADDTILYAERGGDILRVPSGGGTPQVVVEAAVGETFHGPQLLPGGQDVLFTTTTARTGTRWDEAQVVVQSLSSGQRTVVLEGGSDARYLSSGHLAYAFGTELFVASLDIERMAAGNPQLAASDLVRASFGNVNSASANYAVSDDGMLVHVTGAPDPPMTLVWVDAEGEEEALNAPPRVYIAPQVAPGDSQRVRVAAAVRNTDQERGTENVMVWDDAIGNLRQITFDTGRNPLWTPDGAGIVFESDLDGGGLFLVPSNGGTARRLFNRALPFDWTPTGAVVVHTLAGGPTFNDVAAVTLEDPGAAEVLVGSPANEKRPALSPDGQWLAYDSNETGRLEVYVSGYPDVSGGPALVSVDGGVEPRWAPDGRTLYYWEPDSLRMMAVAVETDGGFTYGMAEPLFSMADYGAETANFGMYDVAPDGRFLLKKIDPNARVEPRVMVIENWFSELERLVPPE